MGQPAAHGGMRRHGLLTNVLPKPCTDCVTRSSDSAARSTPQRDDNGDRRPIARQDLGGCLASLLGGGDRYRSTDCLLVVACSRTSSAWIAYDVDRIGAPASAAQPLSDHRNDHRRWPASA